MFMDKHKQKLDEKERREEQNKLKNIKKLGGKAVETGDGPVVPSEETEQTKEVGKESSKEKEPEKKGNDYRGPRVPKTPEERKKQRSQERYDMWVPKTRLGKMVRNKELTHIDQVLASGLPIREPEIVDVLLPDMEDEVLDVNMVQRMTDSGRRVNFTIAAAVGNGNGYVGLGRSRGKEVGPAIRKCIDVAKMNIIKIRRGCGSWECGCGKPHTFPFKVEGKCGSVRIIFKPAPRGVSLAVGNVAKHLLKMSGIEDAWAFASGQTRTTINFAYAVFDALKKTGSARVSSEQEKRLNIVTGMVKE